MLYHRLVTETGEGVYLDVEGTVHDLPNRPGYRRLCLAGPTDSRPEGGVYVGAAWIDPATGSAA